MLILLIYTASKVLVSACGGAAAATDEDALAWNTEHGSHSIVPSILDKYL